MINRMAECFGREIYDMTDSCSKCQSLSCSNECFSMMQEEESSFDEHIWYNKIQSQGDLHDGFQPTGSASEIEEGLLEEHYQTTTVSCHQPCCTVTSNVENQHMDGRGLLFLKDKSPLRDDDTSRIKYLQKPPCFFSYESQHNLMQTDNLFKNMVSGSQQIPSEMHGVESSAYASSCPPASPPPSLESSRVPRPSRLLIPSRPNEKHSPLPTVPMIKDMGDSKYRSNEDSDVEVIFLAECVLHELEMVASRLAYKTRICLRDALYHLAKNTQRSLSMEGAKSWAEKDEKTRKTSLEMEASTINGVIVTMLMFRPLGTNA